MDLFKIMIAIVPLIVIYTTIDWEIAYYKKHQQFMRYRTTKAKMPVYLTMLGAAVLSLLVCLPFILLTILG